MQITEELLKSYADGAADAEARAAVEAAMTTDSSIRERVEAHRRLRGASGSSLSAPLAGRRRAAGRAEPAAAAGRAAVIVDLAAVRARKAAPKTEPAPRRSWVQWSALVACLAVGVILARGLGAIGVSPLITDSHGTLMAQGPLSRALDQQIAGSPTAPDQAVRIGVSFRTADKLYCRTFQVMRGDGLAGLACRAPGGWQVRVAAASTSRAIPAATVSAPPPAVSATVSAMIEGQPLDAQAEAAVKAKGWRE